MLNLVFELLKLFSEGSLPATAVQRIAAAAFADGWGNDDALAKRLANAGAKGQQPGNCQRDILRLTQALGIDADTAEPYHVVVPTAGGGTRSVAVCLPHEQYQLLAAKHGIDAYRLSHEAWNSDVAMGPLLRAWGEHPEVQMDCRDVAMVGLHADGVSYTSTIRAGSGAKSVLVASFNFVSAPAAVHRGRGCLYFVLSKGLCCDCGCEGFHTWNPLFQILSWSMAALKSGIVPTCRHDGSQWSAHDSRCRLANVPWPGPHRCPSPNPNRWRAYSLDCRHRGCT